MGTFTIQTMKEITCVRCGCLFALSESHFENRRNYGKDREFYCPNGHPNYYKTSQDMRDEEDLRNEIAKLADDLQQVRQQLATAKDDLVTIRHRAEQAEAKASEQCAPSAEAADCPTEAPSPSDPYVFFEDQYGRTECPHCGRGYRGTGHLRNYILREHEDVVLFKTLGTDGGYRIEKKAVQA